MLQGPSAYTHACSLGDRCALPYVMDVRETIIMRLSNRGQ